MNINIILSDKPSELNKQLINFFHLNILSLNTLHFIVKFDVARETDINKYENVGIKKFPVLIYDNTHIIGTTKIISYIKTLIQTNKNKILNKSDDEKLSDFWQTIINKGDDDINDEDDISKKISSGFKDRDSLSELNKNKSKSNNHKPNNPKNVTKKQTPGISNNKINIKSADDDLMKKFFENMGETNIYN